MSNFAVNGAYIKPQTLVKLDPRWVSKAMSEAKSDGADNIFFKAGQDTYVASAKNLPVSGLQVDNVFEFKGQKARVIALDNEANSMKEHLGTAGAISGAIATVGAGWVGLLGMGGAISHDVMSWGEIGSICGKHALGAAAIALTAGTIAVGVSTLAEPKLDLHRMQDYGSVQN